MTDQARKKQPLHKIQRGSIEAAMWENVSGGKTWHSIQIYRRYKTEQGEYREANSYALADLVQVSPRCRTRRGMAEPPRGIAEQLRRQRRGGAMKKDDVVIFSYTRRRLSRTAC